MIKIAELQTTMGRGAGFTYVITEDFKRALTEALDVTGYSVPQLSAELGLVPATIYNILNGKVKTLNRRTYKKIMTLSTWNTDKPQEA